MTVAVAEPGPEGGVVIAKVNLRFIWDAVSMMQVGEEGRAIEHGLKTVEEEKRPFRLNVHLPIGLPEGGRPGASYSLRDDMS